MLKDVRGTNALTVLFSSSETKGKTKLFFCPYRKNIVGKYQGSVVAIQPGYDPGQDPLFFVRPQRQEYKDNINYIFTKARKSSESVDFWIQDQYFDEKAVRVYHCFNCQAPQLYYDNSKAVEYKNKNELNANTPYVCDNCKITLNFMGIVSIKEPLLDSQL